MNASRSTKARSITAVNGSISCFRLVPKLVYTIYKVLPNNINDSKYFCIGNLSTQKSSKSFSQDQASLKSNIHCNYVIFFSMDKYYKQIPILQKNTEKHILLLIYEKYFWVNICQIFLIILFSKPIFFLSMHIYLIKVASIEFWMLGCLH